MRYRIWLLALVCLASLSCAKEKASETSPAAAAVTPTSTPYPVQVTVVGLAGYANDSDRVWALLPKAHPATGAAVGDPSLPPGTNPNKSHYPAHYPVLKVSGENVRGFDAPVELVIPIDGYDLIVAETSFGTGTGLDCKAFRQEEKSKDKCDAAVDKLETGLLDPNKPSKPDLLAARVMLPKTDINPDLGKLKFENVHPGTKTGGACPETAGKETDFRVESVTWATKLTKDLELTLRPFNGTEIKLTLGPTAKKPTVKIEIGNQVAEAVLDSSHEDSHWASYRWLYSLSTPSEQSDCTKHYYPAGVKGGNRCPQKLFTP